MKRRRRLWIRKKGVVGSGGGGERVDTILLIQQFVMITCFGGFGPAYGRKPLLESRPPRAPKRRSSNIEDVPPLPHFN